MCISRWLFAIALLLAFHAPAEAQSTVLQGGPFTPGHLPLYTYNNFSSQPVLSDAGGAGGGTVGVNPSEMGISAVGTGSPPFVAQGTGPNGENICDYDGPTTSAAGYHALCFSPNALGGGLISYNAFGGASPLPLLFQVNGSLTGTILGPGSSTSGDFACWNDTTGTLLSDCGATVSIAKGGTGQVTATAAINALLPSQTGNSGKALETNGTVASWQSVAGGTGTVTSVSVASANGFAGTVATATTTPAITLSTTASGILQGNGTAISAASTTGSGSVVLGTSPTIASPTVTGAFTATGLVTNADLVNASTTVNGQSCVLGSTCTVTAAATGITVGTTTVSGGTTTNILYNNAGVLGERSVIPAANGGAGTITGALKANGAGTVSQAACADLSNGATGCSTATGTSGATIPLLNGANTWSGVQSFNSSDLSLNGSGSGSTVLNASAAASGTLTLPAATDTLVGKATTDTLTNKTLSSPALSGTVTGNNTIPLTILAQSGANTMLGNWTGSTANVLANSMPSCSDTAGNHLNYVSGTGVTCGTSDSHGGTVTSIATTSPITGGTISTTGTIACATCVTSSGGGAITGTAPIAVSAAGVVSITSPLPTANGGTGTSTAPGAPYFMAQMKSGNQSLTSTVTATVLFDTDVLDSGSYYATGTGKFTPLIAGTYNVQSCVTLDATFTLSDRNTILLMNKNATTIVQNDLSSPTGSLAQTVCGQMIVALNGSTDFVAVQVNVTGVTPLVLGSAASQSNFTATRIGP